MTRPNKPWTLQEIKEYLQNKDANYKLLSKSYKDRNTPLLWQCLTCQTQFNRPWKPMLKTIDGKINGGCPTCNKRVSYSIRDVNNKLKNDKRPIKSLETVYRNNKVPMKWQCTKKSCGHTWKNNWKAINGVKDQTPQGCPKCYENDPIYNIDELKNILIEKNINAELLSTYSKDLTKNKLKFKCLNNDCGHIWHAKWATIANEDTGCPVCNSVGLTEKGIKQFLDKVFGAGNFVKVKPDFLKNPDTGFNLEIDCYSEKLNIAIEIHGGQHYKYLKFFHGNINEFKNQQKRDNFKKQKILEKGIKFIELDISSISKIKNIKQTLKSKLIENKIKIPKEYELYDIKRYHRDDKARKKTKIIKPYSRTEWNVKKIKDFFKDTTFKPIIKSYINTEQTIEWECKECNYVFFKRIDKMVFKVKNNLLCKQCTKVKNGYNLEKVLKTIQDKKIPLKLLSTEYKNAEIPLQWKCVHPLCEAEFDKNWSSVNRSSKGSCKFCALNLQRNDFLFKTVKKILCSGDVKWIEIPVVNEHTKSLFKVIYSKKYNLIIELDNWYNNVFFKNYHKNEISFKNEIHSIDKKDQYIKKQKFLHVKIFLKKDIHFIDIENKLKKILKDLMIIK